jgi:ribonuclease VapC
MFVDASALVAMITREPDHADIALRLRNAPGRSTSALALYEATLGIGRKLSWTPLEARTLVDEFLTISEVTVIPIDHTIWAAAVDAFDRFGKGRHPAALNMGDCFSYACAKSQGEALLFKGDDFSRTDIIAA